MENQKLLLYIALSFVLLMLWQAWQQDYGSQPLATEQVAVTPSSVAPVAAPNVTTGGGIPSADIPRPVEAAPSPVAAAMKSGERIKVITDLLQVEIDTLEGDIRRAELPAYPVSLNSPQEPFQLMGDVSGQLFIAQAGLLGTSDSVAPNRNAQYQAEQSEYHLAVGQDELRVPLRWQGNNGVTVTRTYVFHRNSYQVRLEQQVENGSTQEWRGQSYVQFQRSEPLENRSAFGIYTFTGGVVSSPDNLYDKMDFARMRKENLSKDFSGGWIAMIQHYFAAAWIPPAEGIVHAYSKSLEGGRFVLGYLGPQTSAAPGSNATLVNTLYIGPKEQKRLASTAPHLDLTVDYGKLTVLAEPIYWLLDVIHKGIGNWGWSIILLTVLIKLVFFHLSATSYKSMAQMRKLAPRIQSLKDRYGDDRQKLNEAMMEMYRREKINPLGGCLPILVQIPVFIALYWVLVESVELRQAPWVLWIYDLSAQDPYYVLPLVMGVSMFIQQRLSPAPPDPIQAKVMMAMPILFTFMFLFFPAGLVLYWVINNTLSIAQQWYITEKFGH